MLLLCTMTETLYIKHMVCPRCISAVEKTFQDHGYPPRSVKLGEVEISGSLEPKIKEKLSSDLKSLGFELLEPGKSGLIAKIKSAIIEQVHYAKVPLKVNFSAFLADRLNHEYSYLSRLFSSVEGITIEKYITSQKIERVKELLFYNEMTLSQIAYQLDYSSVAHLSAQFKKETGMTPTDFKKQKNPERKGLDI